MDANGMNRVRDNRYTRQDLSQVNQRELYEYLQPIVSGCGGFIKSNGYMVILHDELVMISEDRAVMSNIKIKPLNIAYVAIIKDFINAKKDPDHFINSTYFIGGIQIFNEIENQFIMYHELECHQGLCDHLSPIYQQDDVFVFPTFKEQVSKIPVSFLKITNHNEYYCIPVSKALFPINKDDRCALKIFNWFNDNTRVFKYEVYKKKLKVTINIYTRQFVFGC